MLQQCGHFSGFISVLPINIAEILELFNGIIFFPNKKRKPFDDFMSKIRCALKIVVSNFIIYLQC